jgi:uncharacterized protein
MTPDERQMIANVFDRMRAVGPVDKDRDAEAFINQSVRQIPDSAYLLIQSVLVQEQALIGAEQRIRQLEDQVAQLEARAPAPAAASGGFLGGLFGSKAAPAPSRQSSGFGGAPAQGGSPWGNQAPAQAYQQQPQYQQQPMQAAPAAGGGFMKSAMTTAAGVAGGMLAANAIGNMMKGNSGGEQGGFGGSRSDTSASTESAPAGGQWQDANNNDPGNYQPAQQDVQSEAEDVEWGGGDSDA